MDGDCESRGHSFWHLKVVEPQKVLLQADVDISGAGNGLEYLLLLFWKLLRVP